MGKRKESIVAIAPDQGVNGRQLALKSPKRVKIVSTTTNGANGSACVAGDKPAVERKRRGPKPKKLSQIVTIYRRKEANARERMRQGEINKGFEVLRERIPHPVLSKGGKCEKLRKIDILHVAISYIRALENILEKGDAGINEFANSLYSVVAEQHLAQLQEQDEEAAAMESGEDQSHLDAGSELLDSDSCSTSSTERGSSQTIGRNSSCSEFDSEKMSTDDQELSSVDHDYCSSADTSHRQREKAGTWSTCYVTENTCDSFPNNSFHSQGMNASRASIGTSSSSSFPTVSAHNNLVVPSPSANSLVTSASNNSLESLGSPFSSSVGLPTASPLSNSSFDSFTGSLDESHHHTGNNSFANSHHHNLDSFDISCLDSLDLNGNLKSLSSGTDTESISSRFDKSPIATTAFNMFSDLKNSCMDSTSSSCSYLTANNSGVTSFGPASTRFEDFSCPTGPSISSQQADAMGSELSEDLLKSCGSTSFGFLDSLSTSSALEEFLRFV